MAPARPSSPPRAKQDNEHQQRTEDELPLLGDASQYFLDKQIRRGADNGAMQATDAPEQNHDDQFAGALPGHIGRADEFRRVGEQKSGESGDRAGNHVADALKAKDVEAEGSHTRRIFARAAKHSPEARIDDGAKHRDRKKQAEENEIIECAVVLQERKAKNVLRILTVRPSSPP